MLAVADAQRLILQNTGPLPSATVPSSPAALGFVLAEEVRSDLDSPPYDKAMMDGYAIRSADLATGQGTFAIIEEITAGRVPTKSVTAGQASRIMTGAPIPEGADAVVMVERTRALDDNRVMIDDRPPRPGQNIMLRGTEIRRGDVVLPKGAVLRPQEIGVLATVGRTQVKIVLPPRVSILATGNELVEVSQMPGAGQIRNGNGPMLTAQTVRAGGAPTYLGIARDSRASLEPLIAEGLRADVLIVSGGVSAGTLDLVPDVLREAGVVAQLHKVEMKPGKPAFFGVRPGSDGKPATLVFGLPGNPVSSFVCFELFVRPALRKLRGLSDPGTTLSTAVLGEDFSYKTDRPTYHPARLTMGDEEYSVRPVPWKGSPDLLALTRANALVLFPVGDHHHRAGERFPVVVLGDE